MTRKLKPIVIYNDKFLKTISPFMGINGMAIFPFIILKEKYKESKDEFWIEANKRTINHETIHFEQTLELGVIPFFIWYFVEYLCKLVIYKSHRKAYRNISFEREAFANDQDLDYLKTRKRYNWIKQITQQ